MARRKTSRPKPIKVARVRARAVRGPHKDDPTRWYWRAEVFADGRDQPVWTGWETRKGAERILAGIVAASDDGLPVKPEQPAEVRTFRDLLDYWLGSELERSDTAPDTKRTRQQHARKLVDTIGDMRLDNPRPAGAHHKQQRLRTGAAPSTVRVELGSLRSAWRWGERHGLVSGLGPDNVKWSDRERSDTRRNRHTPAPADVAAVVHHLDGWRLDLLRLLAGTGARIGEISALRVRDVDLDARTLTLRGKTGVRPFPLSGELYEVVSRRIAGRHEDARLWPVKPSTMRRWGVDALAPACKAAGVKVFTPHALRRLAVDRLLANGVDVGTAAELMGHSPEIMLQKYRRASRADLEGAARVVAAALGAGKVVHLPTRKASGGDS